MSNLADKIMKRVRGHGRGNWVCRPKDFLDLGTRAAVDQVLSRLVKRRVLRRVSRGLYDWPRQSAVLKRPVSPKIDAVVDAVARRYGIRVMPDPLVAAHGLGLTDAVPAKTSYLTDGRSRTLKLGGRTVRLRHAPRDLMAWSDRPAGDALLALDWLRKAAVSDPRAADILRARLPDDAKKDLQKDPRRLPTWAIPMVDDVISHGGAAA